jgi:hypothetical protein
MKDQMRVLSGAFVLAVALSFVMFGTVNAEEKKHMHGGGAVMEMHHLHEMMNHGLEMAAGGSNMVMLAEMKMAPSLDPMALEHGRQMMKSGKEMIERALNGPEMQGMHKAGHADDPIMKYTHELGEAMMKVVDMLEKMSMEGPMSADMMTMHHMHIMVNHALEMAAEGASMTMLGKMGMAGNVDKFSVDHGGMMMKDARKLLDEVFGGKAMTEMHEKGVKMDNTMMDQTHKLGEAAAKVIDLLEKMPSGGSK